MSSNIANTGIIQPNWSNANVMIYSWNTNCIEYHIDSVTGDVGIDFEPYQTDDQVNFDLCIKNITGNTFTLVSSNAESIINTSITDNDCILLHITGIQTTVFVGLTD